MTSGLTATMNFGFQPQAMVGALRELGAGSITSLGRDTALAQALGIGGVQLEALGAWMRLANLTKRADGVLKLSPLGRLVYTNDPSLVVPATWWTVHWELSLGYLPWRLLAGFSGDRLAIDALDRALAARVSRVSERTIRNARLAAVRALVDTPLGQRLGLVEWEEERGRVVALIGRRVHHGEIPLAAVGYAVLDWARREGASGAALEVLAAEGGPGPVLHLGVGDLERYLMDLHSDFGGQVLTYSRTADLDQAYFRSEVTPLQVLAAHYLRERENLSWAQALDRARQEVPADDAPR